MYTHVYVGDGDGQRVACVIMSTGIDRAWMAAMALAHRSTHSLYTIWRKMRAKRRRRSHLGGREGVCSDEYR